jgi:hypothetical protein
MIRLAQAALVLLSVSGALLAQTTGVAGVNDLTMWLPPAYAPTGNGTVSCSTFVSTGATGTNTVAISLSHSPSTTAAVLLISPLGCVPQNLPFLPVQAAACAGPSAGTPNTNLWLSLVIGGGWPISAPGIVNPSNMVRWNFPLTWPIPSIYVQAVMLDTCSTLTFKFSQAMGFN